MWMCCVPVRASDQSSQVPLRDRGDLPAHGCFPWILKATIQIGGFYILSNGSQLCSDPDAVGWFPPFSLSHPSIVFGLNPVCKDQIGIVYVGVFHHKTQIHTFYL